MGRASVLWKKCVRLCFKSRWLTETGQKTDYKANFTPKTSKSILIWVIELTGTFWLGWSRSTGPVKSVIFLLAQWCVIVGTGPCMCGLCRLRVAGRLVQMFAISLTNYNHHDVLYDLKCKKCQCNCPTNLSGRRSRCVRHHGFVQRLRIV